MLEGSAWKGVNPIILRVIHIAIEDVSHVQTGNTSVVTKDAKVRVRGNIASLKELLGQGVGKRMGHIAIVVHQPRMIRSRLEENLPATRSG